MAGTKNKSGGPRPNSGPKKKLDLVPANFRILVTQKAWLVKHGDQNKTIRRLIQAEIDKQENQKQMKQYHEYTLQSGQKIFGHFGHPVQLPSRFQIWAGQEHGTTDAESLACYIADQPEKHTVYFESTEEVERLSKSGFEKIKGAVPPDFTDWERTPKPFQNTPPAAQP